VSAAAVRVLIMKRALLVIVGVPAGLLAPGVAHAETPPGCATDRCTRAFGRVALGEDGWSSCTARRC
jgi:hypothetical protein